MAAIYKLSAENALNALANGMEGWLRNSHITWGATALAYGVTHIASNHQLIEGLQASDVAKCAFLAVSIYNIFHSSLTSPEATRKSITDDKFSAKPWIIGTNTLAGTLYATHRLGIANKLAIIPVIVSYAGARLFDHFIK